MEMVPPGRRRRALQTKKAYYGIGSILCKDNDAAELKIDCMNDLPFHSVSVKSTPTYSLWQMYLRDLM